MYVCIFQPYSKRSSWPRRLPIVQRMRFYANVVKYSSDAEAGSLVTTDYPPVLYSYSNYVAISTNICTCTRFPATAGRRTPPSWRAHRDATRAAGQPSLQAYVTSSHCTCTVPMIVRLLSSGSCGMSGPAVPAPYMFCATGSRRVEERGRASSRKLQVRTTTRRCAAREILS